MWLLLVAMAWAYTPPDVEEVRRISYEQKTKKEDAAAVDFEKRVTKLILQAEREGRPNVLIGYGDSINQYVKDPIIRALEAAGYTVHDYFWGIEIRWRK